MAQLPSEAAALIARAPAGAGQAREIAWAHAKLDKVNFELARLKRWKFGAKTEAMTARQRACSRRRWLKTRPAYGRNWPSCGARYAASAQDPKATPRRPRRG